jgi:hypothetical protein
MTINVQKAGTDLDSLLAPIHSGWPAAAATAIQYAGSDLNLRFAAASSGTAYGTTNLQHNGTDVGTLFAALGTTNVAVTSISAVTGSAASSSVTSGTTSTTASKGKQSGYTYTWTIATGSGITFTGQSTASTAVSITGLGNGLSNNGTFYCAVSDGTTTTNTNTVAWSLTNTSSSSKYSGTITQGTTTTSSTYVSTTYKGFVTTPVAVGSRSPTTLTDGKTLAGFYDVVQTVTGTTYYYGYVVISGFSSDPGKPYLTSAQRTGSAAKLTTDATCSYSYSSGSASWTWYTTTPSQAGLFGFLTTGTVVCTLI